MAPHQRLALALGLLLALAGMGFGFYYLWTPRGETKRNDAKSASHPEEKLTVRPKPRPPEFFKNQPAPDLVLLLSGQMYGYLQPCGCARPQLGGLERRYEALKQLRDKGWAVSAADLGDLAPKQTDRQGRIKFETALKTLHLMNYAAVGIGTTEVAMSLEETLGIGLNYQPPAFLAANVIDKESKFPEMYRPWVVDEPHGQATTAAIRVGYVGIIGKTAAEEIKAKDASLTIGPVEESIVTVLEQLKTQKIEILVLLFHGSRAEARPLAARFPQFRIVLTLDDSDEPSALPEKSGDNLLISVGHKGKYIGLVGVNRQGSTGRIDLRYELAAMSEGLEPPDDATNPAREEMRGYVRQIYQGDFLSKWPRSSHPLQLELPEAQFAGAAKCQQCHPKAFAIWSAASHSHAYESLEKQGRPLATIARKVQPPFTAGRQHDPECARCHTTGFDYKTGFVTEQSTPYLKGNQCENCHGPASLHVAHPQEPKYSTPLRLTVAKVEYDCRKCHDGDNDPKFKLEEYWPKIQHGRE
jgi:hypothetical protein